MVIHDDVVSQAARRIAEHAATHALPEVQVVLHGGEPLLAGRDELRRIIAELHRILDGTCHLDLRIHTNGVRLREDFCELFAERQVKVGISIDGDQVANDRHRLYADGRSSYRQVVQAIELLQDGRFRDLYAGLLCTIDVANDPLVVYEALMALRPPRIDFLLPHATWDHPPTRKRGAEHEYADWLTAIYDQWIADGRPAEIRTFDSIIATLRGGDSLTEALGLGPTGLVVIETDGSYEQVDSLKVAYGGAPETGMNVFSHSLDMVAQHPGIAAREQGIAGLCRTCQECPVVSSCGGGLYTHRYRHDGSGFDNPSVYCADLLTLISHISRRQPEPGAATPERAPHAISTAHFTALAAGLGDEAAITSLVQAQRSLVRALLTAVYRAATTSPAVAEPVKTQLQAAWSVLAAVDRDRPDALAELLDHPYLRAWAVRCVEQLRVAAARPRYRRARSLVGGGRGCGRPGPAGRRGHRARAGRGRAPADARPTGARARPGRWDGRGRRGDCGDRGRQRDQQCRDHPGRRVVLDTGPGWSAAPVRPCRSRPGAAADLVTGSRCACCARPAGAWSLEDTDPYRDGQQWSAAPRLTAAEVAGWQRDFQLAWQQIEGDYLACAPALAAGLTRLTPLLASPDGPPVSAVDRQAFGAVAASRPADPAALARLFITEFQRVKLGAILDLFDLYDRADDRLFQTPWGEEKVQLDGLLQGAYIHLAGAAGGRSAEWPGQTREAIDLLLGSVR